MSALELDGLSKRYGRVWALRDVSFSIPAGVIALVAGANGAGKSTLLRIIAGLTRPSRGRTRVLGADPFGPGRADLRRRVGFLGADAGLYAELTLEENLSFCAELRGASVERVRHVLREHRLSAVAKRRAGTLSLGFRRRAGVARAMLGPPELLLLDEPWNGLDADAAERLCVLLRARREAGGTLLIAAHAFEPYADLFDATVVLSAGTLEGVSAGTPIGTPLGTPPESPS